MSNLHSRIGSSARPLPPGNQPLVLSSLELARGEVLYRRGDPADSVYRVEAGLLKLFVDTASARERILGLAGPGDLIGAVNSQAELFTENAEALSRSVKLELLATDASLAPELRLAALKRQQEQLIQVLEYAELPVPARLARTLARLAERFGQPQAGGAVRLTLPLTHDNLAAIVGAARETTSFTLAEMRRAGVIAGTRGVYTVQPVLLHEYALLHGNA